MPKEVVYDRQVLAGNVADAVIEHVAIGWSKGDGLAQIGFVNGDKIQVVVDGEVSAAGLWMDLDREQINRLIRSLRAARDGAYGPDA